MTTNNKTPGTIKKLMRDKGFGFIRSDHGVEYFFHRSSVSDDRFDDLTEGSKVIFDEDERASKGPRADHVELM